jgi:hypothetical protein
VYNISSHDERYTTLEEIDTLLKRYGLSYCFKTVHGRRFEGTHVHHSPELSYSEVLSQVSRAKVILDIQQKGQTGLSLRPFEAIGLQKKLITTNASIRDYDFYHPNNIMIIDPRKYRDRRELLSDNLYSIAFLYTGEVSFKKLGTHHIEVYRKRSCHLCMMFHG